MLDVLLGNETTRVLDPRARTQLGAPAHGNATVGQYDLWRWVTNPFVTAVPNQNPQSLGVFVYNLRLPGQCYQAETGLYYNMARDYDAPVGRYVESDPVGLTGGGYSGHTYANDNPIARIDPLGRFSLVVDTSISTVDSPPGSRIGSTKGTLSSLQCVCDGCGSSWTLTRCAAFLDIQVSLLVTPDLAQAAFARKAELEHVDGFRAGARDITQAGTMAEEAQQRLTESGT